MGEILHKNIGSTGALTLQLLEGNNMVIDAVVTRKYSPFFTLVFSC